MKREVYRTRIAVPPAELARWDRLLDAEFVDFAAEDLPKLDTAWCRTAKFPDGFEVDVKVCTDRPEDGTIWSEAVLFSPEGAQFDVTDCSFSLKGEWTLSRTDRETGDIVEYRVDIVEATA